ncbi:hypothetical protein ACHE4L_004195, partial [Vibrio vulnificus]
ILGEVMSQKCGLCLKERELKISHLMPKGLYKKLRKQKTNSQLILSQSSSGTSGFTDKQVVGKFLCDECEQKFSKNGENTVVRDCFDSRDDSFPLLSMLDRANVLAEVNDRVLLDCRAHLDTESYQYFAASIFWRASAWNCSKYKKYCNLGVKYQEEFRLYLNGEAGFPKHAYITVYIDSDDDKFPMLSFPVSSKKIGYHQHVFYVPGVRFSLRLGRNVGEIKNFFEAYNSQIMFLKYSFKKHPDCNFIAKSLKVDFTPSERLKEEIIKNV